MHSLLTFIGLTLFSCAFDSESEEQTLLAANAEDTSAGDDLCVSVVGDNGAQTQILYAGQTIEAGTVTVEVDGEDLLVTYETTDGWELEEAHLWTGLDLADMPQTSTGNPKIGRFPYNSGDITGATSHAFRVPLEELGFSCPGDDWTYYIAAHAALRKDNGDGTWQTETGWADGEDLVDRGSWATYFEYTLTCDCEDEEEEPEGSCETIYAYGGDNATCFIGADFDGDGEDDGISRWGWSNDISAGGDYTFELYGGAGQCDLSKGTYVGDLIVTDNGDGTLTVEYAMAEGFSLDETHLYVGDDPLATGPTGDYTVAPGQYPEQHDLDAATSDSYTVDAGDFIVAHGVSCGDFGE